MSTQTVQEVTAYLGANHPTYQGSHTPLKFDGVQGNRAQHARQLKHLQEHLENLLTSYPREDGESLSVWVHRLHQLMAGRRESSMLDMIGRIQAIIDRFDDEAELDAKRKAEAKRAEEQARLDNFRREATPNQTEVAALKATIEDASKHEDLLARVFAAFTVHRQAEEARKRLAEMFDRAESARAHLKMSAIRRPKVADAPAGAVEFANRLQVIATR